jgi:hypothetical protein
MGRLLAVVPDIVELLALVTLLETSMGYVHLYPDPNIAKACQFEYYHGTLMPEVRLSGRGLFMPCLLLLQVIDG